MSISQKEILKQLLKLLEQENFIPPDYLAFPKKFVQQILGYQMEWFHKQWLKIQLNHPRSLILAPRGHGKSTICTISYSLFQLLKNPDLRILIVSNTQSQASAFLREIRSHLESNPKILSCFQNLVGKPWNEQEINLKIRAGKSKEANITAMGVLGPIIARHYDVIILDDVVDEENSRTRSQREKLLVWYYKVLLPCLEPEGRLHIIGTRYHYLDLYGYLIEGEFKKCHWIYRAIQQDENGKSALWEEKFPLQLLEEKRQQAGTSIFNSQYQNDVELMKGRIFKPEWFQYYSSSPLKLKKAIGIDLALSEKKRADFFALVVAGREEKSGKIYLLDWFKDRLSFSRQVQVVRNYFQKHNQPDSPVVRVYVEANAYQEAFAQKLREVGLPVKSLVRVKDKLSRAYQLQARFENGEIYFPQKGAEPLIEELLLFPEAEHDDLFDALELAVNFLYEKLSWKKWGESVRHTKINLQPD